VSDAVLWIDTTEGLRRHVEAIGRGPIALDTEADSYHHFREKVCLVQISSRAGDALVDPLAGVDVGPLRPLLSDPEVGTVLHGADYDLRMLRRDFGLEIRGLFDTMIAARLVGERSYGLQALLRAHLGIEIDKAHQRDDWSARPLPAAALAYAAADTRSLLALRDVLAERLDATGRSAWAAEEFERLEEVRFRPSAADLEAFRGVKGASRLDRRALAVLRELFLWRDGIAEAKDVPRFRVARDELLADLARLASRAVQDLAAVPGIPRSLTLEPHASAIRAALERGLRVPERDLPAAAADERRVRDVPFEQRLKAVRVRCDALARDLNLDPSVLATRSLVEAALRRREAGEPLEGTPGLRRWQIPLLGPLLP
jgi:ribonuclease D